MSFPTKYLSLILVSVAVVLWPIESAKADDAISAMPLLLRTLDQTENPDIQASLLRGILSGLDGQRNVRQPKSWRALANKLGKSEHQELRQLTLRLSQFFGDAVANRQALALIQDTSRDIEHRRTALHSLLAQHNPEVSEKLESLLDEPMLRLDAIRGYAAIENAKAAETLLNRYGDWEPPLQRAVLETLATRRSYARSLLKAIKNEIVSRDDVPTHVARSLSQILGDSFAAVYGDVHQLAADREKLMAKYKRMITPAALADANVSRGREVFAKTCAACHLLYGTGGNIGPDLTGSNRANLDYILLNSVDPSFDVPDGYKMELIQTVEGRMINGVIAEEDDRRVVIKTVEQPRLVIAKVDIEKRKTSPKSMMPDGQLEQMAPREVVDLIKYLRTTAQVELPQ